ncbi:MAG: cell surface protein SprA [Bacteroidetes bacterium]|nr:cell surface protein SprA [Bacteroidota bacterium]
MRVKHKIFGSILALSSLSILLMAYAGSRPLPFRYSLPEPLAAIPDSPELKYPLKERDGDFVSDKSKDPFYLKDPPAVEEKVEYDPVTGMYVVTEKVGGSNVRPPTYMTYDDYLKYTEKQERDKYWKERAGAIHLVEEKNLVPPIQVKKQFFDRLFGGSKIEIRPQGNVEMTLGTNFQKTANPNIPIRNRKTGGFDFDMNINLSVIGKIGDKLQLGIKYNTQSGFQFDNQVKIGYTGDQDDIIKVIEAGNVSLPLNTRLITGSQALFGVKAQLQFGRLTWTSIISQQKSKKETMVIENGAQRQNFEIRSDQYDENRHFFLSQYFYDQYDNALSGLPNIRSVVNITRMEVWVTNRTNVTQNVRDVLALMDLGEAAPYSNKIVNTSGGDTRPRNEANDLYPKLVSNPSYRFVDNTVATMLSSNFQLEQGQDFEKTYARRLNENEYTYHKQLGYLSLNSQLNPNEVLAVAFQYEYNGAVFQVGEFGNQIPPDSNATSKVLYLKMLKGTSVRPTLPIWRLMMKNIYSLGAYNVSNEDFRLDIYYNDPGGGLKRYMPKGCIEGKPIIRVMNLDKLNANNDPQPDGLFDFIPGVTILPQNGRLIFPVVEPFGSNLRNAYTTCGTGESIINQYTYDQLYDSTKFRAQQYPEFNRFVIKGQYKGTSANQISLGAGNIPRGSVVVTAGGQKLVEGAQYTVDYNLGRVTILDQGILNSGQQVKVDYENNNLFATQVRSLFGTRLDYRISNKINIGGTLMHMGERPFTQKVNIGDDPIQNTIMGLDFKYETNAPWLTKALDKLPFYSTKEMSTISTYGEFAYLKPGHSKAINGPGKQGQVYIDDFEGTSTGYDLRTPAISWKLASTPRNSPDASGKIMFPEANLINDDRYGYNRAKLAWYRIDNSFFTDFNAPAIVKALPENTKNHYVRLIPMQEVFPNRPVQTLDQNVYTLDLAFYPRERGPYNYEYSDQADPGFQTKTYGVNKDGSLKTPRGRWAGVMRGIDNSDLEATNVEYIEFWMMDPFLYNTTSTGGKLYFNLGSISEDILRDSRMSFENGLSADTTSLDNTAWGRVPRLPPLVDAFDNDPALRNVQDLGLDGLSDEDERQKKQVFLNKIQQTVDPSVFAKLQNDPSSDNYVFFKDEDVYGNVGNILTRYKDYCGPEGNSPVQTNSVQTTAQTNVPDKEDLNRDNSLNENEEYFQYELDLKPGMDVGNNPYIVSKVEGTGVDYQNIPSRWLQFRIPIQKYSARVGGIPDFKSIQFMRMFMTGWEDTAVVLRFATLELRRNQWRTYNLPLDDPCEGLATDNSPSSYFNVASVGVETNSSKTPVNYILPPDIERQQTLGAQANLLIAQDEQSIALSACDLKDCQTKAVFKNLMLDLRRYKTLKMFVHANRVEGELPVHDKEVTAFVRVGSDFKDNYYQYEIPLTITADGSYNSGNTSDRTIVWPDSNVMDITLKDFIALKQARNATPGFPHSAPFYTTDSKGKLLSIVGNPDIGAIKTMMLGIRNPGVADANNPLRDGDDGQAKCVEVWFNEMRVNGFEEFGGSAALGTMSIKLADLGNVNLAGEMHTKGFGQVEQKIEQRYKDNLYKYDFSSNIEVGKLLPAKAGIRIPFYGNYSQAFSTPEFDPYQFDIPTREAIKNLRSVYGNDSARNYRAQVQTINTNRGFNFSNVRVVPQTKQKAPQIYDPGNFNLTYSYNELLLTDPFIEKNSKKAWLGLIGWSYAPQIKDFTPLKKVFKSKSKWFDIIRDFNFNPFPSTLAVTTQWTRDLHEIKLRPLGEVDFEIPTTYSKNFRWIRTYTLKYNPFKSLSIDFNATNNGRLDEPDGPLNTKEKRQEVWHNFKQGGRNTNYNQSLAVSYNIPINKIPIFDFINSNVGYTSTYNWTAFPWQSDPVTGKLVQNTLANTINNSQNSRGKVDLNFRKIYDKIPFLKTYNSPNPNVGDKAENTKKREATRKAREKIKTELEKLKERRSKLKDDLQLAKSETKADTSGNKKATIKKLKKDLKANRQAIRKKKTDFNTKQFPSNSFISIPIRPLLALKRATIDYKENKSTTLPGFVGYSQILGNQVHNNDFTTDNNIRSAPGFDFVFGGQPGDRFFYGTDIAKRNAWLDRAAEKGWISKDTLLNQQFTQLRSQRLDITTGFEPFPDLKVDFTLFWDKTINHLEFFKYVPDINGDYSFQHLNPVDMGSYTISYLPVKTMFKKIDAQGFSEVYRNFEANREIISQRLGTGTYFNPSDTTYNNAYTNGYGPKSQDVLIPAFLAAYEGKNPNKINLNPFRSLPMPNWRIAYTGFSKFKWIQKVFSNLTITHGYSSTLTVSSFQTNLDYTQSIRKHGEPGLDSLNGNFYPAYNMPSVLMNEQFSPLIGIDMTTKNNITAKFDYKMSRMMTMNFADFQLIELKSKQVTFGAGYKVKGLKLPIRIKGKKIRLDNDLNFRFDFSYRDNVTINHRIDELQPQITQGAVTYTIQPSIDYIISKQLNVRLFFDQTRTIPKISNSFATTNTRAGLTLRFTLAQ